MSMRQGLLIMILVLFSAFTVVADDTVYPAYLLKAQSTVSRAANTGNGGVSSDEVLIAQNYIRNAETEYKKHLSWTGKLDPVSESTVRYFATMAELQANLVLSKSTRTAQQQQLQKIMADVDVVKSKIKVFEDKNDEIAGLKKAVTELNNERLSLKNDKEQLLAKISALEQSLTKAGDSLKTTDEKVTNLSRETERCSASLAVSEKKNLQLNSELEKKQGEITTLTQEVSALASAKGISENESRERIKTLNRQKEFVSGVALLGGVVKPGSENMTVVFSRSALLKAPKNDSLNAEGEKLVTGIVSLLANYPEYRIKLKVHGFGTPAKNEDSAATDRMARMIREAVLAKGKFEPARVDALGIGTSEPTYPKKNIEGNRRVELIFEKQ